MGANVGSSNPYSLIGNHAYSLIGCYTISKNNAVTNRLYKIRNPWGQDAGFAGAWNDNSALWTADVIAQTTFVKDSNDGDIWVEDKEFVQGFSSFSVAYYNDNFVNSRVEITGDNLSLYQY